MGKKDPFMKSNRLHTQLTNEQCCQLVAMRDVKGVKAAEHHFGVPVKTQASLSTKVKARPELARTYWQYRNKMAKGWVGTLGETSVAILQKIQEEVNKPDCDLLKLRELGRIFEILGDVSTSVMALAPQEITDDTPLFEVIDVEEEGQQLLLSGAEDGVAG